MPFEPILDFRIWILHYFVPTFSEPPIFMCDLAIRFVTWYNCIDNVSAYMVKLPQTEISIFIQAISFKISRKLQLLKNTCSKDIAMHLLTNLHHRFCPLWITTSTTMREIVFRDAVEGQSQIIAVRAQSSG
jgi:hypothetical protein